MAKGFIEAHIARGNRNTFLIGLVLTVIGVALSLFLNRWSPAIIAVPGVIILGVWLLHVVNPRAHPVYKQLARYGDPQQLGAQINQEFASRKADDKTQFGARWLAQGHTYGVALVPWSDIAWLHIYTHIRNRVPSHYVRVYSCGGNQFVSPAGMKQEQVEQLLRELYARAPWAEVGYTPELIQLWRKQRAEFLKRVAARKAQYLARPAQ